jgi:hypothetical protein
MRQHYIDAFDAWDRSAAANTERRRDYRRARDMQAKRLLSNVGTCVPHGAGDQQPLATSQSQQPAAPLSVFLRLTIFSHLFTSGQTRCFSNA